MWCRVEGFQGLGSVGWSILITICFLGRGVGGTEYWQNRKSGCYWSNSQQRPGYRASAAAAAAAGNRLELVLGGREVETNVTATVTACFEVIDR